MDPFIGQIQAFGFNYPPAGWARCDGQLLAISSNTSLFSLLGTQYGGDGKTTFALPDLRGRSIVNAGNGPGLNPVEMGEKRGVEEITLTVNQLPEHSHSQLIPVNSEDGATTDNPEYAVIGNSGANAFNFNATPNKFLKSSNTGSNGAGYPIYNRNPYLVVNVCISLYGIYPSRG